MIGNPIAFPAPSAATRACRVCGCTDARACVGGCWWVAEDLCSACAGADPDPDCLDLTPHQVVMSAAAYAAEATQRFAGMSAGHDPRSERGVRAGLDALLLAVQEVLEALGDQPADQPLADAVAAHRDAARELF